MKRASWFPSIRLLPLLALLLTACGGTPTQKAATPASKPTSNRNADELTANALGLWASEGGNASQALSQLQRAAQLAPQRPEIVWVYLRVCQEVQGCDPEPIEMQLRKLDPGSGSVWLGALARAQARRDARAEEQILEVMSKATHFNVYWTPLISQLTPALAGNYGAAKPGDTPLTNALNNVIGWLSRLDTPAFTPLSASCNDQRVREPATRVRCDSIAQALRKSDTTLAEGLGLGISQRLVSANSPASLKLIDQINTLRYQNRAAGAIVAAQLERDKFSEQMLKLMAQLKREQDVFKAIIRWAGQPLTE
jgi:hypothetical protein